MTFANFLRIPILVNICERLLLNVIFQNSFEWLVLKWKQKLWETKTCSKFMTKNSRTASVKVIQVFSLFAWLMFLKFLTESVSSKCSGLQRTEKTVK